jgi:predicted RNase H-like nuclease (RuvC/YqgF family)
VVSEDQLDDRDVRNVERGRRVSMSMHPDTLKVQKLDLRVKQLEAQVRKLESENFDLRSELSGMTMSRSDMTTSGGK